MSHTYAVLKISPAAYIEILEKLKAAGYEHAIDGGIIDMHGLALEPDQLEVHKEIDEMLEPEKRFIPVKVAADIAKAYQKHIVLVFGIDLGIDRLFTATFGQA